MYRNLVADLSCIFMNLNSLAKIRRFFFFFFFLDSPVIGANTCLICMSRRTFVSGKYLRRPTARDANSEIFYSFRRVYTPNNAPNSFSARSFIARKYL